VPADSSKLKALSLWILSISLVCGGGADTGFEILKLIKSIGLNRIMEKG